MESIWVVGASHHTAPLEVREKLAVGAGELPRLLEALRRSGPFEEAVAVSTCNRTEFYVRVEDADATPERIVSATVSALARLRGEQDAGIEESAALLYVHRGREAVRHLFRVAASLDSMVLGETQILGQVREAFETARENGHAQRLLARTFDRALKAARAVHRGTGLTAGALSVASVAVDLAGQIFGELSRVRPLVIGAGQTAELLLRHLTAAGARRPLIANRDPERAGALAAEFDGEAFALDRLTACLEQADVVISSTGSPRPLVGIEHVQGAQRRRASRPLFLIDLAVPRDVDPAVGTLESVYLYDLDDLQQVVARNLERRAGEVERGSRILEAELEKLEVEARKIVVAPTIAALTRGADALVARELERVRARFSAQGRAFDASTESEVLKSLERIARGLLHEPIRVLKEEAARGEGLVAASWLAHLFALERAEELPEEDRS